MWVFIERGQLIGQEKGLVLCLEELWVFFRGELSQNGKMPLELISCKR